MKMDSLVTMQAIGHSAVYRVFFLFLFRGAPGN